MHTFIQKRKWKLSDIRLLSSSQLTSFLRISSATVILCAGRPPVIVLTWLCLTLTISHFTWSLATRGHNEPPWSAPATMSPHQQWHSVTYTIDHRVWCGPKQHPGDIYLWSWLPAHCAWLGCDCEISVLKLPEAPRPLGQSLSWSALPGAWLSQL